MQLAMIVLAAAAAADPAAEVHAAVDRFLAAFENLDFPAFRACFEDDASVFFPAPEPPARADGRAAIEARFHEVFDSIRAGAKGGPPYHRLQPEDLRIEALSPDVALVTFHLRNAQRIARRTLLFRRRADGWRIAHLHASNAAPP